MYQQYQNFNKHKIDSDTESEIRWTCRNFIKQLIYELRQRLPKNFAALQNTNFFSLENSIKYAKGKLYDNLKNQMENLTVDEIRALELQWQKLSAYNWPNQKSTTKFWISVFEYTDALKENSFK